MGYTPCCQGDRLYSGNRSSLTIYLDLLDLQNLSLGLFRSDYMINVDPKSPSGKPEIKQVEFNTIASSFGGLSTQVSALHKYIRTVPHVELLLIMLVTSFATLLIHLQLLSRLPFPKILVSPLLLLGLPRRESHMVHPSLDSH